jgi:hypothetical protein
MAKERGWLPEAVRIFTVEADKCAGCYTYRQRKVKVRFAWDLIVGVTRLCSLRGTRKEKDSSCHRCNLCPSKERETYLRIRFRKSKFLAEVVMTLTCSEYEGLDEFEAMYPLLHELMPQRAVGQ